MATITQPAGPANPTALPRFRWTTAQFDRLVAEGFLREGGGEFLWDGEIIAPMAEEIAHANASDNLVAELQRRLSPESWTIYPGHPLALSDGFLPQPDVVVARGPRSRYRKGRPAAADAALVVEVANTTWFYDSGEYLGRYALEGIPIYWILHIKARRVEVYSRPDRQAGRYQDQDHFGLDQAVPLTLDGQAFEAVPVEAILRDSLDG